MPVTWGGNSPESGEHRINPLYVKFFDSLEMPFELRREAGQWVMMVSRYRKLETPIEVNTVLEETRLFRYEGNSIVKIRESYACSQPRETIAEAMHEIYSYVRSQQSPDSFPPP